MRLGRVATLFGAIVLFVCQPALAQQNNTSVGNEITVRELLAVANERERSMNQRFADTEKAVSAALAAAKEAVAKAEAAAEKRYESLNEFRGTLRDQQATLIPRAEVTALLKSIDDKQRLTDERLSQLINRGEGVYWLMGVIGAGIGGLVSLVVVGLAIWRRSPA